MNGGQEESKLGRREAEIDKVESFRLEDKLAADAKPGARGGSVKREECSD